MISIEKSKNYEVRQEGKYNVYKIGEILMVLNDKSFSFGDLEVRIERLTFQELNRLSTIR